MLRTWYERWITQREAALCFRSNNRVVRPFEWGVEWTAGWPVSAADPSDPERYFQDLNKSILASPEAFFAYEKQTEYRLEGEWLRFRTPLASPHPANNLVHALWCPAERPNGKAVVVLPHWNSTLPQHVGLAK